MPTSDLQDRLHSIAARAQWITERAQHQRDAHGTLPRDPVADHRMQDPPTLAREAQVAERVARWQRLLGASADQANPVDHRLADLDCSRGDLGELLQEVGPVAAALPAWSEFLAEVLAPGIAVPSACAPAVMAPARQFPFVEVLAPFAQAAVQRLRATLAQEAVNADPTAVSAFTLLLHRELSRLAAAPLYVRFAEFRRLEGMRPAEEDTGGTRDRLYRAFTAMLQGPALLGFLDEYPVLARLLGELCLRWVQATAETVNRLARDHADIEDQLGHGMATGHIVRMDVALSDAHAGARTVCRIQYASGLRVLYKPRGCALETHFNALLDQVGRLGAPYPLRTYAILPRDDYAWVEHVDATGCADDAQALDFHRHLGALLAIVYLLEGTDCHFENVIAAGACPVLIDGETLLHPRSEMIATGSGALKAVALAHESFMGTVLRTHLLPRWEISAGGHSMDLSATGAEGVQESGEQGEAWSETNQDGMRLELQPTVFAPAQSLLSTRRLPPEQAAEAVVEGFARTADFLRSRREAVLTSAAMQGMLACRSRLLFRDTRLYSRLLRRVLHPRFLRSGVEFSLEFEPLARSAVGTEGSREMARLVNAEVASMLALDVPRFECDVHDGAVYAEGARVLPAQAGLLSRPALAQVLLNFAALTPRAIRQQVAIIRGAFQVHRVLSAHQGSAGQADPLSASRPDAPAALAEPTGGHGTPRTHADLRQRALLRATQLAERLREVAHRADDGATWLAYKFNFRAQRYQLSPLDFGLYDGAMGLAIFFAGLARVSGNMDWRELALATLRPVHSDMTVTGRMARYRRRLGIGLAEGIGSLVYGHTVLARLLDPTLIEHAESLAMELDAPVPPDHSWDLLGGTAGAVLALVALHEATVHDRHLARAQALAQEMMQAFARQTGAGSGFPGVHQGLAHGRAGLDLALSRLSRATRRDGARWRRFCDGLVLRGDDPIAGGPTWCYGFSGRSQPGRSLFGSGHSPAEQLQALAGLALQQQWPRYDHVCCGVAGMVDALVSGPRLASGERQPELDQALQLAVDRLLSQRWLELPLLQGDACDFVPGFFQGLAGIGYTLLRYVDPGLPAVCAFEV